MIQPHCIVGYLRYLDYLDGEETDLCPDRYKADDWICSNGAIRLSAKWNFMLKMSPQNTLPVTRPWKAVRSKR
jgi:hypothetical protein